MHATEPERRTSGRRTRLAMVVLYALSMAWVEAAVVLDLRTLIGQYDPALPAGEELSRHLLLAECIREGATLAMLFAVGWLAGESWRSRLAAGVVAFGLWDIGYYLFLIPLTGWPSALTDWDILFLLPLPWWGPVWAPVSIAVLLVLGGGLVFLRDRRASPFWPRRWSVAAAGLGAALALLVFMSEALHTLPETDSAPLGRMPERFATFPFLLALALMAVPVIELAWRAWCRPERESLADMDPGMPVAKSEGTL